MTMPEDSRDPDLPRPATVTPGQPTPAATETAGAHVATQPVVAPQPVVQDDAEPPPRATRRPIGLTAHVVSIVVAVVALAVALVLVDYTASRTSFVAANGSSQATVQGTELATALIAFVLMVLAAGIGRLSALGPLIAGLIWGVAPFVLALVDPGRLSEWAQNVQDKVKIYDAQGLYLAGTPLLIFPAVAGLMLGAAFVGRWRGRLRQYDAYGERG